MKKIILIVLLLLAIGFAVKTSWMYSKNAKSGTPISAMSTTTVSTLTRNLTFGDTGSDVVLLHNFLMSSGFLASGNYTNYGSSTWIAVRDFQTVNGISPVDGFVGAVTRAVINAQLNAPTSPTVTILTKNLGFGDQGPEVDLLQNFLIYKGLLPSAAYTSYDIATENAVSSFQSRSSLEPSGYVDPQTRSVINMLIQKEKIPSFRLPTQLTLNLSEDTYATDAQVYLLQNFLKEYGWLNRERNVGTFDAATTEAVIDLQQKVGITPANGIVGVFTRTYINNALNHVQSPSVVRFEITPIEGKTSTYEIVYAVANANPTSNTGITLNCPSGVTVQKLGDDNILRSFTCGQFNGGGTTGTTVPSEGRLVLVFTNSTSKNATVGVTLSAQNMISVTGGVTLLPKGTVVNPPQPEPSCKSVKSSGFKLDPSSYTVTMIDKKGDKDFNVSLVPNNSCVKYKYTVEASGELAGAIKGTTQGTATGKTTIKKSLSDSKLSVANPRMGSTTYKGQLKVTIVSTTNSADKVTLTQNLTVTVKR